MSTSLKHNMQSLRKFKDKSHAWIVSKSDVIAVKIERLMIMCNGYNKIQPVRLSRGVATMVPETTLVRQEQCQFRPCLGSRRTSRGRETRRNYLLFIKDHCLFSYIFKSIDDVIRKPSHDDQVAAAKTRITFCASTDEIHWGSDISEYRKPTQFIDAYAETSIQPSKMHVKSQKKQQKQPSQYIDAYAETDLNHNSQAVFNRTKEPVQFCCDCGCMLDDIDQAIIAAERKIATRLLHPRNRVLVRQYTAPARCR